MRVVAILGAAAALRLGFFTGMILYDDAHYLVRVVALAAGEWSLPGSHFEARLGVVAPAALAVRLLGASPAALAAWSFACSMGSVLVAYALGRRLLTPRAGILAALLVAVCPLDVLGATNLLATAPQALFVGAALGLFLLGDRERRPALHLAAGLSLGAAGLVHEVSLLALVFYPIYAVTVGRPSRHHLWLVAGAAAVLAIDPLVHGALGDPLARIHRLQAVATVIGTAQDVDHKGLNLAWLAEPILRSLTEQELGVYPLLVAPLAVWRLLRPARSSPTERALAIFVVAVGLWTCYGSTSPSVYAPLARVPRYLAPLLLPAAWLLGHELAERRGPRARAAILALVALTSLACVAIDGGRARMVPPELLRDALARERPARVVVEPHIELPLRLAERFRPPYVLEPRREGVDPRGALFAGAGEPPPGATLVAEVVPPRSTYQRVLASAPVMALLRLSRPSYRVDDLRAKLAPEVLRIYRVP
jgi:hypothetical protein